MGSEDSHRNKTADDVGEWFAESTLRIGLAIVGLLILLFGVGQAVGIDLVQMILGALNTSLGQWLVVAFFGLVLIVVALYGFGNNRR